MTKQQYNVRTFTFVLSTYENLCCLILLIRSSPMMRSKWHRSACRWYPCDVTADDVSRGRACVDGDNKGRGCCSFSLPLLAVGGTYQQLSSLFLAEWQLWGICTVSKKDPGHFSFNLSKRYLTSVPELLSTLCTPDNTARAARIMRRCTVLLKKKMFYSS